MYTTIRFASTVFVYIYEEKISRTPETWHARCQESCLFSPLHAPRSQGDTGCNRHVSKQQIRMDAKSSAFRRTRWQTVNINTVDAAGLAPAIRACRERGFTG